jgi:hypothetical protein
MSESTPEVQNSVQPAQTTDLDQQIAAQKVRLADQERLLHAARMRYRAYSDASLFAFESRERRAELWHKIVEQPNEKYLDAGQLPDGASLLKWWTIRTTRNVISPMMISSPARGMFKIT